jgi:hypothetical protein
MLDVFWGCLSVIVRAINFVLEIWVSFTLLQRFGRFLVTGRAEPAPDVKVPPDPKIIPPAAERALAEAEQRHRDRPEQS